MTKSVGERLGTLFIIKSTNGNIFGGYTEANWLCNQPMVADTKARIFSLVNKHNKQYLFPIRTDKTMNAITHHIFSNGQKWFAFGTGYDLGIADKSNSNTLSYTWLKPDYNCTLGDDCSIILAGTYNYRTTEIEIYDVCP